VISTARFRRSLPAVVAVDRRTLLQCVLLSMLLHVWIVVLFGTATYSGSRRGPDFGDALNVSLRALTDERGAGFRLAPGTDAPVQGSALLPRAGGVPAPSPRRAAERPPEVDAARAPPAAGQRDQASIVPEPPPMAPPAAPAPPPAAEPLPRLNLEAPEQVDRPYLPVPPPLPVEREATPPAPAAPREVPAAPAVEERITPPPIEREAASPVDAKPLAPPSTQSKPRDTPPAPVERATIPGIDREIAPAAETMPSVAPPVPVAPAERVLVPRAEPEPAPPLATPQPAVAAPPPVARPEAVAPGVQREVSPPIAPAAATAPRSATTDVAPRPANPGAADRAPPAQHPARTDAAPAAPPRLRLGAPEPDEDMFKPRRDAVTPPEPGAAPRLDLDEARKRAARDIVREGSGSRGMLPVVPPPPDRESKEARALAKAAKPDCRTAYGDMGLLAAVPLVASAIGNSGCRW
jgi:hypothetical protein